MRLFEFIELDEYVERPPTTEDKQDIVNKLGSIAKNLNWMSSEWYAYRDTRDASKELKTLAGITLKAQTLVANKTGTTIKDMR